MLNFEIAMFTPKLCALAGIMLMLAAAWLSIFDPGAMPGFALAGVLQQGQEEQQIAIQTPGGGSALQGVVAITGTTQISGFRAAEIAFAYQSDPTGTWFLIQQLTQPVNEGSLASWDTTTITDGDYRLRLQVFLQGGEVQEFMVSGLRVRNYTRIETSTPEIGIHLESPTPTASPLADFQVTPRSPTPAPTNPAEISTGDVQKSVFGGAAGVLVALAVGALYIGGRKLLRR